MTIGAFSQLALVETYLDAAGATQVADSFRFTPTAGAVGYDTVDLGFPDVRAAVQDLPDADGTYDETRYTGARVVNLTGKARQNAFGDRPGLGGWDSSIGWNSASWWCRYLSAWAYPARRSRLYFTDDSGLSRFMDLRGESFSSIIDDKAHAYRVWQMQFVCPSGKIYSFDTSDAATSDGRTRVLIRQTSIDLPGRVFPWTLPLTFPPVIGQTAVAYDGTVANGFVANIYTGSQPMVAPRITVTAPDGTTQSIGLSSGYAIPARSVITVDTLACTVMATLPDGSTVELDEYLAAPLQWPQLRPGRAANLPRGTNAIGFTLASGASEAYIEVLYRNADLE